jgi:hypothetical protein
VDRKAPPTMPTATTPNPAQNATSADVHTFTHRA